MTDSIPGALGPPMIDGYLLDGAAVFEQDVTARKVKSLTELANGGRREAFAYAGAGYPLVVVKHRIVLRYRNMHDEYDRIEELLGTAGPHELVVWKRVHPVYIGDAARTTFYLPWQLASHFYSWPPSFGSGAQAASAAEVRVGFEGTPLTVLHKNSVDYAAGTPGATEAWFLEEGQEFKLNSAPAADAEIYVRFVPILQVFDEGLVQKTYPPATFVEPRDVVLLEE